MVATLQPFTLCADDYALSAEVDAGILQLLRQQRLGAVSCLVTAPRWTEAAPALAAFAGRVDLGLHLDFTEGFPGQPGWRLSGLMLLAWLRCLPVATLEREIARQLGRFEAATGRLPDYIDGHQHVHQLPQVADALLRQVARHWSGRKPWLRLSRPRCWRGAKAALIGGLGAGRLRWQMREAGILCNPDFAGVYSLSPAADYRRLMQAWLASLAPGGLIMCHPAMIALEARQATDRTPFRRAASPPVTGLAQARLRELQYLCGSEFTLDCRVAGRLPVRFRPPRPG